MDGVNGCVCGGREEEEEEVTDSERLLEVCRWG